MTRAAKRVINSLQREISALQAELKGKETKDGNSNDRFSGDVRSGGHGAVLGSEGDMPMTCRTCEGTGLDSGALYEAEPCPTCLGAGEVAGPEIEFDYDVQAWTRDGRYVACAHTDPRCGCFGKVHAGELRRSA